MKQCRLYVDLGVHVIVIDRRTVKIKRVLTKVWVQKKYQLILEFALVSGCNFYGSSEHIMYSVFLWFAPPERFFDRKCSIFVNFHLTYHYFGGSSQILVEVAKVGGSSGS